MPASASSPRFLSLDFSVIDDAPSAAIDAARAALSEWLARANDGPDSSRDDDLRQVLRRTSGVIVRLPKRQVNDPVIAQTCALIRELLESGAHDSPVPSDDLVEARRLAGEGWPGLLGAMLLTPAWQWPDAPSLEAAPGWLWADYARWLFAVPVVFEAGAESAVRATRTEELARWTERNVGSAAVREALAAWLPNSSSSAALWMDAAGRRRLADARARILARYSRSEVVPFDPAAETRAGRRLRIGFLDTDWTRSPSACALLARFEHLPSANFEVVLLALAKSDSPFAQKCRSLAAGFHLLPESLEEQAMTVQGTMLDVLVFPETITTAHDDLTRLALHRNAPLQVLLGGDSGNTSGFPEIDLRVGAEKTAEERTVAPENLSERLAVPRGPSPVFALQSAPGEDVLVYSREGLGDVPTDAVLLVTVLDAPAVASATLATWARILERAPGSRLLVYVTPGRERPPGSGERLLAAIRKSLHAVGVDPARVIVLAPDEASFAESRAVIGLADVFLAAPGAEQVFWQTVAIDAGLPVTSGDGVEEKAARLAVSAEARQAARQRLEEGKAAGHGFLDTLAASDAFGHLIETAFDELEAAGRKAFRASREPVRCDALTTVAEAVAAGRAALERNDPFTAAFEAGQALRCAPDDPEARHLHGLALLAGGRTKDAVKYLLAAVEQRPKQADYWFALTRALAADGQKGEATRALQTCLRLDSKRADGWLLLAQLAGEIGASDLATEAGRIAVSLQSIPSADSGKSPIKLNLSARLRSARD
ncbi:hypothetical protein Ga0100231_020360 [Opitutaceae bacterium TAV4]|nr:hypothetical protein Ga0100231_020360 [Opitutaceae bacterium TAV4]